MIVNQKFCPLLPILFFSINILFSNQSSAQANLRQADIRPNPLDEIRYRQSIQHGRPARPLSNSNIGKSDLGIQRPVEAKKQVSVITWDLILSSISPTIRHPLTPGSSKSPADYGKTLFEILFC